MSYTASVVANETPGLRVEVLTLPPLVPAPSSESVEERMRHVHVNTIGTRDWRSAKTGGVPSDLEECTLIKLALDGL